MRKSRVEKPLEQGAKEKAINRAAHNALSGLTLIKVFFTELQEMSSADQRNRFIESSLPVCINSYQTVEALLKEILQVTAEEKKGARK